jgi:hypothetical protein
LQTTKSRKKAQGDLTDYLCLLCFFVASLRGVPEHGEEVAGGPDDNKQMPDEMVVPQSLRGKKSEARCVGNSPGEY